MFCKIVDENNKTRSKIGANIDHFFLAVYYPEICPKKFFRRQVSGEINFSSIGWNVYISEGIDGSGPKGLGTAYGLMGTLATLQFKAGHVDASVFLRTGHHDSCSLKS